MTIASVSERNNIDKQKIVLLKNIKSKKLLFL